MLLYDEPYGKPMEEAIPEAALSYTHILVGAKRSAQSETFAVAAAGPTAAIMAVSTCHDGTCTDGFVGNVFGHGKCEKCGRKMGTVEINGVYWCVHRDIELMSLGCQ